MLLKGTEREDRKEIARDWHAIKASAEPHAARPAFPRNFPALIYFMVQSRFVSWLDMPLGTGDWVSDPNVGLLVGLLRRISPWTASRRARSAEASKELSILVPPPSPGNAPRSLDGLASHSHSSMLHILRPVTWGRSFPCFCVTLGETHFGIHTNWKRLDWRAAQLSKPVIANVYKAAFKNTRPFLAAPCPSPPTPYNPPPSPTLLWSLALWAPPTTLRVGCLAPKQRRIYLRDRNRSHSLAMHCKCLHQARSRLSERCPKPMVSASSPLAFKDLTISNNSGDVMHVRIFGQSMIILDSLQAARDLLDKRSSIYSDRPRFVLFSELWVAQCHQHIVSFFSCRLNHELTNDHRTLPVMNSQDGMAQRIDARPIVRLRPNHCKQNWHWRSQCARCPEFTAGLVFESIAASSIGCSTHALSLLSNP